MTTLRLNSPTVRDYIHIMKKILTTFLAFSASVAAADSNPYTVESAIYRVEVPYPKSKQIGFGTGVLVAQDKILTNCHVLKSHPGWPRVVHRKTGQQFYVTKHYNLGKNDACVLVGGFAGTPVRLSADIQEGQNVWIFGYPAGLPVVGQGTIKGLVDTDAGKSILLAAFCAPGSSGGPVVNVKGELVGLNWGVFRYQNQCLSIPASFIQPYLTAG
ncbi:serine protease [Aromatoleum evansii]|uniref:Serine protease n=1 Tax=Aromatoleum evansii TaxID=59406 RepID=A0ABZ1AM37_AROEV|nr:serine protease [Aromatoleum evansii]